MKIPVKDLRPNPFRDLKHYPVDPVKVDSLVASIKETDFWDNLVARKDTDGGYELAYGVHRLAALKKARIEEIDIPVRKLSDTIMIKMMALENMEDWATNAMVAQETIRAIVKAFGEGKIELPKVKGGANGDTGRYAPSFMKAGPHVSGRPETSYSADTLSKFLGGSKAGWTESKVEAVLSTLVSIEQSLVNEKELEGLSIYQAEQVARQTRRVLKETEGDEKLAKSIGKRLADGMRSSTGRPGVGGKKESELQVFTYHNAARVVDEMLLEEGHDENRKRATKKRHQQFNRQVADYISAMNTYRAALKLAQDDVERFAPEAVQYVLGRHTEIRKLLTELEDLLKKKKKAA